MEHGTLNKYAYYTKIRVTYQYIFSLWIMSQYRIFFMFWNALKAIRLNPSHLCSSNDFIHVRFERSWVQRKKPLFVKACSKKWNGFGNVFCYYLLVILLLPTEDYGSNFFSKLLYQTGTSKSPNALNYTP